jgi:hypothetical protein
MLGVERAIFPASIPPTGWPFEALMAEPERYFVHTTMIGSFLTLQIRQIAGLH